MVYFTNDFMNLNSRICNESELCQDDHMSPISVFRINHAINMCSLFHITMIGTQTSWPEVFCEYWTQSSGKYSRYHRGDGRSVDTIPCVKAALACRTVAGQLNTAIVFGTAIAHTSDAQHRAPCIDCHLCAFVLTACAKCIQYRQREDTSNS